MIDEISPIAFAKPSEAISIAEKLNALASLSKVLGVQINRQEISGPGGAPVQLDVDASNGAVPARASRPGLAGMVGP